MELQRIREFGDLSRNVLSAVTVMAFELRVKGFISDVHVMGFDGDFTQKVFALCPQWRNYIDDIMSEVTYNFTLSKDCGRDYLMDIKESFADIDDWCNLDYTIEGDRVSKKGFVAAYKEIKGVRTSDAGDFAIAYAELYRYFKRELVKRGKRYNIDYNEIDVEINRLDPSANPINVANKPPKEDAPRVEYAQNIWKIVFEVRDIVRDMKSLAEAVENNNNEIRKDLFNRNISNIELCQKCEEESLKTVPRDKRNYLYLLGNKMRTVMAYLKVSKNSEMIEEICKLDIEAVSSFYYIIAQIDPEERKTDFPGKGVADGLLSMQEIRQMLNTTSKLCENIEAESTPNYKYNNLANFIDGGIESIEYMMNYKQPRDGVKLLWNSAKGDVLLFCDILSWTIPEINRCIRFKGGKKVSLSNRKKNGESPLLRTILQGIK